MPGLAKRKAITEFNGVSDLKRKHLFSWNDSRNWEVGTHIISTRLLNFWFKNTISEWEQLDFVGQSVRLLTVPDNNVILGPFHFISSQFWWLNMVILIEWMMIRMCCSFYWYLPITKFSPTVHLGITTTGLNNYAKTSHQWTPSGESAHITLP